MVRSHTFETRDRIRKIECIKVKAEESQRAKENPYTAVQTILGHYLEPYPLKVKFNHEGPWFAIGKRINNFEILYLLYPYGLLYGNEHVWSNQWLSQKQQLQYGYR